MTVRTDSSWQIILADLALILFLVTLSALPRTPAEIALRDPQEPVEFAPSQALFRPEQDGLTLKQWLKEQAPDPRATLTVHAIYKAGAGDTAWSRAKAMVKIAQQNNVPVRVVIARGEAADIYASLGYDAPPREPGIDQRP